MMVSKVHGAYVDRPILAAQASAVGDPLLAGGETVHRGERSDTQIVYCCHWSCLVANEEG